MEKKSQWLDPRQAVWGFHCHQELPLEQFAQAMVVQEECARFLQRHGIGITSDAFEPGYGPHVEWMWEIRIENRDADALEQLGLAAAFFAANRNGLISFIHPLMHNESKEEDLETEGRLNQTNILWFGDTVVQNQDFFFNPPRDQFNKIADTRTPRMLNEEQKAKLRSQASKLQFRDPLTVLPNGVSVQVDFAEHQFQTAIDVREHLLDYLADNNIRAVSSESDSPPAGTSWEVRLLGTHPDRLRDIGLAIACMMCNRHGLSVRFLANKSADAQSKSGASEQPEFFIGDRRGVQSTFALDEGECVLSE